MAHRICLHCGLAYSIPRRGKKRKYCSDSCMHKARNRRYYEKHKEKLLVSQTSYQKENRANRNIIQKRYYEKHKAECTRRNLECQKKRREKQRQARIKELLSKNTEQIIDGIPHKVCLVCRKKFAKKPSWGIPDWNSKRKYCSPKCYFLSKKGKPTWNKGTKGKCKPNKGSFTSQGKKGNTDGFKKGHRPWNYLGIPRIENDKLRRSPEYVNWRKVVYERDNYTCQKCGQYGGEIEANHIKPFALYPELRFNIENGQTLCKMCHDVRTRILQNEIMQIVQIRTKKRHQLLGTVGYKLN